MNNNIRSRLEKILQTLAGANDCIPEERRTYFPARCPGVKPYRSAHDYGMLTEPPDSRKPYKWCGECRTEYDRQVRHGERSGL